MTQKLRFILSNLIGVSIAILVNIFFGLTHVYLIPLTTFVVMQTSTGNVIYQGLIRLMSVLFVISLIYIFLHSQISLFYYLHDAALGAVIGILSNLFILPRHPDIEFRERTIPVLEANQKYFAAIIQELLNQDPETIDTQGNNLSHSHKGRSGTKNAQIWLEKKIINLPSWVYASGFDSGLRRGHQFFLNRTERISDILFSMHHLACYKFDEDLMDRLHSIFTECAGHVEKFFTLILTIMRLSKTYAINDFLEELEKLDKKFREIVPYDLETIDIRRDYVYLGEFIFLFNELRSVLIKLIQALR